MAALARDVLALIAPRDSGAAALALDGELGAGKTTLAQAIARELGVAAPVQSPTFPICRRYDLAPGGRFSAIFHFDLYRLAGAEDLGHVGWAEALAAPRALVVVEWPERAPGAIPGGALWVRLRHGESPSTRVARVGSAGE